MCLVFCFIERTVSNLSVKNANKLRFNKFGLQYLALLCPKLLKCERKYQLCVCIFLRGRDRCVHLYGEKNVVSMDLVLFLTLILFICPRECCLLSLRFMVQNEVTR